MSTLDALLFGYVVLAAFTLGMSLDHENPFDPVIVIGALFWPIVWTVGVFMWLRKDDD